MSADALDSFEQSLDEYDVPVTRTTPPAVPDRIADLVDPPAVGVDLSQQFEDTDLSLADTDVTLDPTPVELRAARTGVTSASMGIGDYGTVALEQTVQGSELVSLFVDRHVVVVRAADVVDSMERAFTELDETVQLARRSVVLATGPSATADMGALVQGAHGPRSVDVLLVEGGG